MPNFFLIAGPNGVGKSTKCKDILPLNCEIIDYDYIFSANYRRLDPSVEKWDKQDVTNAKTIEDIELRKQNAFGKGKDIAIHSNLHPYNHEMVKEFSDKGYTTNLYFIASDNVEVCKFRVQQRAYMGEHNVHEAVIEEKYTQGLSNLKQYHQKFDKTVIFDNTSSKLTRVAKFEKGKLVELKSHITESLSKKIDFVFKAIQEKETQVKKGLNLSSW